jgi:hypothetical protein
VTQPATTHSGAQLATPLHNFFLVVERILRLVHTPGGRILIAMWLVVLSLFASWVGIPLADHFGTISYIALVVLVVKDPRRAGLVEIIQKAIIAKLKI